MKDYKKELFSVIGLMLLAGCSSVRSSSVSPPVNTTPPVVNTGRLGENIRQLELSLASASSRVERIKILTESLKSD
jgi:uncharacterized protein YcfL